MTLNSADREELKRLAEAVPEKVWTLFDINNTLEIQNARRDAKSPIIHWGGFDQAFGSWSRRRKFAKYIAAAYPQTILTLLTDLEAAEKRIAELEGLIKTQSECGGSAYEIKRKLRAALKGQSHDDA